MGGPDPLAAHRIALRALVGSGVCGPLLGLLATLLFVTSGYLRLAESALAWALFSVGMAAACALLLVAEGLALRLPPRVRPPALIAIGAGGGLVVACAVAWALAFLSGGGSAAAWSSLQEVVGWCLERPQRAWPLGTAVLLALASLGSVRVRPRPFPLAGQALVGAAAGLAGYALVCAAWRPPSQPGELALMGIVFAAVPGCAPLGLRLAERLELALLRRLARED